MWSMGLRIEKKFGAVMIRGGMTSTSPLMYSTVLCNLYTITMIFIDEALISSDCRLSG